MFSYIQHFYLILQSKIHLRKNGPKYFFLILSSPFHLRSWLGVLDFLGWFSKLKHAILPIKIVSSTIFTYCLISYCKVDLLTKLGQTLTFGGQCWLFSQTLTFLDLRTFSPFFTKKAFCLTYLSIKSLKTHRNSQYLIKILTWVLSFIHTLYSINFHTSNHVVMKIFSYYIFCGAPTSQAGPSPCLLDLNLRKNLGENFFF